MLVGGAALFATVELLTNSGSVVSSISAWTHRIAVHAPQSPQDFKTNLEQNTTSGMHGGIFWQGGFSQGMIKQPSKANIAAAIAVTMEAMGDHSPAAAMLAACAIAVENGEMDAYWEGPVRTHLEQEMKNRSFVGTAANALPSDVKAECITIDEQLLPHNAIFPLPQDYHSETIG